LGNIRSSWRGLRSLKGQDVLNAPVLSFNKAVLNERAAERYMDVEKHGRLIWRQQGIWGFTAILQKYVPSHLTHLILRKNPMNALNYT